MIQVCVTEPGESNCLSLFCAWLDGSNCLVSNAGFSKFGHPLGLEPHSLGQGEGPFIK